MNTLNDIKCFYIVKMYIWKVFSFHLNKVHFTEDEQI